MNDLKTRQDLDQARRGLRPPTHERSSIWRRLFWLVVVIAVGAGIAWWIHTRPVVKPSGGRITGGGPTQVVAATAEKGDINITLNALGTVTPLATVTVKTQINGQLTHINFQEGQLVHAGELLAEIDSRPYELALGQAQGQLLRDQALLKNAELDLVRYRTLVAQDSIPTQQLDTQAALVRQYEGTVRTDQAQVDNAKLNIAYCHIVAPLTGRIGLRLVDQGNYVQVGDPNGLIVITQVQPITVVFNVPEDNLPAIAKRLRAGADLPATAYDRGLTAKLAVGKLVTFDNQIDTTTGTVKLKAQFDNQDEALFPNQFVNIQLVVDTLHDATVLPSAAIQRGAPGTFVYLVKPDNTVAVVPIKLGPNEGERVSVLSGVKPGDKVVVDGADKLREGAAVSMRGGRGKDSASPQTAPEGK